MGRYSGEKARQLKLVRGELALQRRAVPTWVIGGLVAAAAALSGCGISGSGEIPTLKIDDPFRTPPAPEDTELRLSAGGYEGCAGDDEVTDISVQEDPRQVLVEARVNVDQTFGCEITTSATDFSISLNEPLGTREVVDVSGSQPRVFWSPSKAVQFRRVRNLTNGEAAAALRSEYPGGTRHRCARGGVDYFYCSYRRRVGGPKTTINLIPRLEGGFDSVLVP
jgi:hypothetical protein